MPAKVSDEQQHQRRSKTRREASPSTQLKTPDEAANVEQQAERTLTRKEEKALCLAVQVCIYNCGTCYIALHYCLRLASYIDSFFGQLDFYTLMQSNAALIMQQKSDDSLSVCTLPPQDSEFIELHRWNTFASDPAGKDAKHKRSSLGDVQAPISGQNYERLQQWKNAVGAKTFAELQVRRDRCHHLSMQLVLDSPG